MQVNFTGLKNISSIKIVNPFTEQEIYSFNVQLTDDDNGEDLTEFNSLRYTTNTGNKYKNPVNEDFVNIFAIRNDNYTDSMEHYKFLLNGQPLVPQRKVLPFFTFLAKLTRNVQVQKKFGLDKDYITSEDARYGILPGHDLHSVLGSQYEKVLEGMSNPSNVKLSSRRINNMIQGAMEDYLA